MIKIIPYKSTQDSVGWGAYITHAAVHVGQFVYVEHRHANIMAYLQAKMICKQVTGEMQGFVCCNGFFLDRYMAGKIAAAARQLSVPRPMGYGMISEHIFNGDGSYIVPKSEWRL